MPTGNNPDKVADSSKLSESNVSDALLNASDALLNASDALLNASDSLRPPKVNQLTWGRWSWAAAPVGDDLSQSFNQAIQDGKQATAGNLSYVLMRAQTGPAQLASADTSARFRLASSAANYVRSDGQVSVAKVESGNLNINFANSTFSTNLDVSHPVVGNTSISGSGSVRADGLFSARAIDSKIAGGLSLDGTEAGYLFEKSVTRGQLNGITLWGR
jgi:hypothetical protein